MSSRLTLHNIVVGADLTPKVGDNLKFLIGGYMGLSHANERYFVKTEDGRVIDLSDYNEDSFLIGAKTGLIYEIGKSQVEFGAKFDNASFGNDGRIRKFGAYLGYNHKF